MNHFRSYPGTLPLGRMLLVAAMFVHLHIAWSLWTSQPLSDSPSMLVMQRYVPEWFWTMVFATCGATAALGLLYIRMAKLYWLMGGSVMLAWGIAGMSLWAERGPQPGAELLIYICLMKWTFSYYADRLLRVRRASERLGEASDEAERVLQRRR